MASFLLVRSPRVWTVALVLLVAGGARSPWAATPRPQPGTPATVDALAWLAGCWGFQQDGRIVEEQWMPPAGGVMLAMSRAVRAGRAESLEFVVLRTIDGRVVYEARPLGQGPARFTLVRAGDREVVFENLAHDFPQRIIYRRDGEGRLSARIEGERQGSTQGFDYPFERRPCPCMALADGARPWLTARGPTAGRAPAGTARLRRRGRPRPTTPAAA